MDCLGKINYIIPGMKWNITDLLIGQFRIEENHICENVEEEYTLH